MSYERWFSWALIICMGCTGTVSSSTTDEDDPVATEPGGSATRDGGSSEEPRADSSTSNPSPSDGGSTSADGSSTPDGGGPSTPSGAAAYRGALLFREAFEDASFGARGWYDSTGGTIAAGDNAPGGTGGALECRFTPGGTSCAGGSPARHPVPPMDAVLLSLWVKHTPDWEGSGRAYHPHLFHFVTNQDGDYVGPAMTHLTLYVEHVNGRGMLALGDGLNVDTSCVRRNDGSFVGCGGDFATYSFTEMRSVAACNGLEGDVDSSDCFPWGSGSWYSSRAWYTRDVVLSPHPGPTFQGDWHHIEAYFALNTVSAGTGVVDGSIRYWFDGELQISSDRILFRTGQHPTMLLDQFLMLPYIGDGSPRDQTIYIDEIEVYEGARP
jgi:hypothetical protein